MCIRNSDQMEIQCVAFLALGDLFLSLFLLAVSHKQTRVHTPNLRRGALMEQGGRFVVSEFKSEAPNCQHQGPIDNRPMRPPATTASVH